MNIYAKKGTKVLVTEESLKNGYNSVEQHARAHLKAGNTYTIDYTEVEDFNTNVYLEEFPDEMFNSVSFVGIDIKPTLSKTSKPTLHLKWVNKDIDLGGGRGRYEKTLMQRWDDDKGGQQWIEVPFEEEEEME